MCWEQSKGRAGPVLAGKWEQAGGPDQEVARFHSAFRGAHLVTPAHWHSTMALGDYYIDVGSGNIPDCYPWRSLAATAGKPPFSVKLHGQNLGAPSGSDNTFCPLRHWNSSSASEMFG